MRRDVRDTDIWEGLKWAAADLKYPTTRGIPIDRVDTHSLRGSGANALHLAGYPNRKIQMMGHWRGGAFKEHISKQLAGFLAGMLRAMKRKFHFVNIGVGAMDCVVNVTDKMVATPYKAAAAA